MDTDISKQMDEVIRLLREILYKQRVATLLEKNVFRFNFNGQTIHLSLPDAQDDYIQKVILQTSCFFEAALLSQIAKMGLIGRDTVVCDIGANIGNHSVYFGRVLGAQIVISCEPKPHVYSTLQRNLELNELPTDNAFNVMLGKNSGRGEVEHFNARNHGATMLKASDEGQFEMMTLDALTAPYGAVGFLKLDVEGFEASVLDGAERVLSKDRPPIWVELAHGEENINATRAILEANNYKEHVQLAKYDFVFLPK